MELNSISTGVQRERSQNMAILIFRLKQIIEQKCLPSALWNFLKPISLRSSTLRENKGLEMNGRLAK
jgi:hypothetical protein